MPSHHHHRENKPGKLDTKKQKKRTDIILPKRKKGEKRTSG